MIEIEYANIAYTLGRAKKYLDAIELHESEVWNEKKRVLEGICALLVHSDPMRALIDGVEDIVRVRVEPDKFDNDCATIRLFVPKLEGATGHDRIAYWDRIHRQAELYFHDRFAGGIMKYVDILVEEEVSRKK